MNTEIDEQRKDLVWETIHGNPVGKANNYMAVPDGQGGRRIIKNENIRTYERTFAEQCKIYRGRQISRPFIFYATVYVSTWATDADNIVKTVLDCLQYAEAVTNDALAVELHVRKVVDPIHPRVTYAIQETEPTLF